MEKKRDASRDAFMGTCTYFALLVPPRPAKMGKEKYIRHKCRKILPPLRNKGLRLIQSSPVQDSTQEHS